MFESLRARVLAILKVPPEPHPPFGDPASLRVFRAGRNAYRLRMVGWGIAQLFALLGIVFWTGMLIEVERLAMAEHAARKAPPPVSAPAENPAAVPTPQADTRPAEKKRRAGPEQAVRRFEQWRDRVVRNVATTAKEENANRKQTNRPPVYIGWAVYKRLAVEVALVMPDWVFRVAWVLKIVGFAVYLVQLGFTYAVRRLDFEMRWYLVTDRSLRLRHGVWTVWESTMSFANLQQVVVSQGPIQRLLGLADVKVQSAGGGKAAGHEPQQDDMHVGYFHNVTNAEEIRDLILARLRRFRETGLGDPDERAVGDASASRVELPASHGHAVASGELLEAARELAAEARALRSAVSP